MPVFIFDARQRPFCFSFSLFVLQVVGVVVVKNEGREEMDGGWGCGGGVMPKTQ